MVMPVEGPESRSEPFVLKQNPLIYGIAKESLPLSGNGEKYAGLMVFWY
jgi:hypothetical protein